MVVLVVVVVAIAVVVFPHTPEDNRQGWGGGWYACGTKPRGLVACREMPEHFLSVR